MTTVGRLLLLLHLADGQIRSDYDDDKALSFVHLSTAVFCEDAVVQDWVCGPACDAVPLSDVRIFDHPALDAHAFVGVMVEPPGHGACVVSFRGTTRLTGWMFSDLPSMRQVKLASYGVNVTHDGSSCHGGKGFIKGYMSIAEPIKEYLTTLGCDNRQVHVTGHSLGAALAGIAMHDLHLSGFTVGEVYTFGQPRVGNQCFADASAKFGAHRVTRFRDPVPHLPPAGTFSNFRHMGHEIYYSQKDNFSAASRTECVDGEDHDCMDQERALAAAAASCFALAAIGKLLPSAAACLPLVESTANHLRYFDDVTNTTTNAASCASPTTTTTTTTSTITPTSTAIDATSTRTRPISTLTAVGPTTTSAVV